MAWWPVERFGCYWLLVHNCGRDALLSTHGDARSCLMAKRLAALQGHVRLDWVMFLDPVVTDLFPCWPLLAQRVVAPKQGRAPIAIGRALRNICLSLGLVDTAVTAAIRTAAGDHRNMAWLQAFCLAAVLAFAA